MIDRTDWKYVAFGIDSQVYRVGNRVAKLYTKWISNDRNDVLEEYKKDTLTARRILRTNQDRFKGLIKGHHSSVAINMSVLAQGDVIKDEDYLISIGQRFIPGKNLFDIVCDHDSIYGDVYNYMEQAMYLAEDIISSKMHKKMVQSGMGEFKIVRCNVKPIYHEKEKRLDLIITDLSKSIRETYRGMFN